MRAAFLVMDKPPGITSHDVVAMVRAVTGIKKVGHTGTLDPFATGVLPLALGPATKLIRFLDESIKVYDATIQLGSATDTGDPTGEVTREAPLPRSDVDLEGVLITFLGDRMQTPPAYSAVKVKGRRLYEYARKGQEVQAEPRPITIHDLEVFEYDGERLRVGITCSRGTYARVLADEIGTALGSAGHLLALERPRSGPFYLEDALDVGALSAMVAAEPGHTWQQVLMARKRSEERVKWQHRDQVLGELQQHLVRPLDALRHLPLADVSEAVARKVRSGGPPPPPPSSTAPQGRYLVVCGAELVAIAESTVRGPRIEKVL